LDPNLPPSQNPYEAPRAETGVAGRSKRDDSTLGTTDWILAVICSGIGCIMGIIWMIQGKPKGAKMLGVSILFAILWNIVRFAIVAMQQQ
jgi:hypothetical protein